MAKSKFKPPHSDKPKILKLRSRVKVLFLGVTHECSVTQVIDKGIYKLLSTTGTVFGKAQWGKDLLEYSPWYITEELK